MNTHDFVYQTFVIYLFIKSLIFFPLLWVGFLFWRSERKARRAVVDTETTRARESALLETLPTTEPVLQ